MCTSHVEKLQDLANPLKPLGYPLALVNSHHWLWETSQPLTNTGPNPNRQWKQKDSVLNRRLAKAHIQCIPLHEKFLAACKRETMPAMAPWIALFTQDLAVVLKLVSSFLSSKDYFKLHREQLLNKLC